MQGISDKVENKNNAKSIVKYILDQLVQIIYLDKFQNA